MVAAGLIAVGVCACTVGPTFGPGSRATVTERPIASVGRPAAPITASPSTAPGPIAEIAETVAPGPGAAVSDHDTAITIRFREAMSPATLDSGPIAITDTKYSRNLVDLFSFAYAPESRTLLMRPRESEFRWGTGDQVEVLVTPGVHFADGRSVGQAYAWSFKVP